MPATFSKLTKFMIRNMRLDPHEIRLVNQAMGDLEGTAVLIDSPAGTTDVGVSQRPGFRRNFSRRRRSRVSVNISNLDTLISSNGISSVDFLSIDAEGKKLTISPEQHLLLLC